MPTTRHHKSKTVESDGRDYWSARISVLNSYFFSSYKIKAVSSNWKDLGVRLFWVDWCTYFEVLDLKKKFLPNNKKLLPAFLKLKKSLEHELNDICVLFLFTFLFFKVCLRNSANSILVKRGLYIWTARIACIFDPKKKIILLVDWYEIGWQQWPTEKVTLKLGRWKSIILHYR